MDNEVYDDEVFEISYDRNRNIKNYGTTSNNIGVNNILDKKEKERFIQEFIKQIFQKINKEIILVVDRFEGNIAVCEDRETGEMTNIEITKLPEGVLEGDVLNYKNGEYAIDVEKRKEIEDRINNKVKNLFDD